MYYPIHSRDGECLTWRIVECNGTEVVPVVQIHRAEICATDTGGIFQHFLEDGVELAGRGANDLKHLRGRRLLLKRLGQVVSALTKLLQQSRVLDSDDG